MIFIEFAPCGTTHAEQHAAGAHLLEKMIKKYTGLTCKYDEAERTSGGKPYFKNLDGVDFSVSHSGGLAMCAVSVKDAKNICGAIPLGENEINIQNAYYIEPTAEAPRVGADIELIIDNRKRLERISKRFFTIEENEYISGGEFSPERFFEVWTNKESLGKMLGTGLSGVLSDDFNNLPNEINDNRRTFKIKASDGEYFASVCFG